MLANVLIKKFKKKYFEMLADISLKKNEKIKKSER